MGRQAERGGKGDAMVIAFFPSPVALFAAICYVCARTTTMPTASPKPRKRRFSFHYNRPNDRMTVHWKGECIIVDHVECRVPTETHRSKQQPRVSVRGWAESVTFPASGRAIIS